MLGSHMKQINTYGRRAKRVIDAPSNSRVAAMTSTEISSIFEDMPPPPPWKNIASKMKKRENELPNSRAASQKVVGLQKKKRLSPVLSPNRKKQSLKITEHKSLNVALFDCSAAEIVTTGLPSDHRSNLPSGLPPTSPLRAPLSSLSLNLTASPIMQQHRLVSGRKSLKPKKPLTSLVNIDIVVFDDDGRTISKERRVSRGNVNPVKEIPMNRKTTGKHKPVPFTTSDDEKDFGSQSIRRPKRHVVRKNMVISSEEEDSEQENATRSKSNRTVQPSKPSRRVVEVCVPPAPYKIPVQSCREAEILPLQETFSEASVPLPPSPLGNFVPSDIPSTAFKPRQLTPIKGGHKRSLQPPSPLSPATIADFDLYIDFPELNLDAASNDFQPPGYLKPLLKECHQETCGPHEFSAFIETFPYDPIIRPAGTKYPPDMKFNKIGEASYSEVFGVGDVVLKIIPLRDESKVNQMDEVEGPAPTDAQDVRKEIIVTRAMGEVYGGFIKLLKAYVVKGRYPEVLLRLWDEYNEQKGSESVRPAKDTFKVSQTYAIIVLPNGGPDLEAYTFHNASRFGWRQACSLFWQVAKSLARAEHLVAFEHRDLHWGQILVKNLPSQTNALKSLNTNQKLKSEPQRLYMDDRSHGVQATIIDLGLSRMDAGDGGDGERVHWTPFDDEVFMGEGDYQFDVYRMMKEFSGNNWDGFHPFTNVLWLHYLLSKLLRSKGLKPPVILRKSKNSEGPVRPTSETAYSEKDCYDCLVDLEDWLGKTIAEVIPSSRKDGKRKRKTHHLARIPPGLARAGEIVAYGIKKGWIKPSVMC